MATEYENGFMAKCAEAGLSYEEASGLLKAAVLHWTHHLVPWETAVEARRKAGRAIFAAENGHPGLARAIMKAKYRDPKMESLVEWLKEVVRSKAETRKAVEDLKAGGVFPRKVEGNPFK